MVYQPDHQAELAMANEHIRRGEIHLARQRQIVAELREDGHPTAMAEAVLEEFELTLETCRDHRAVILREIDSERVR